MSKVRVNAFSISVDGYGAGTDQSVEDPLGRRGEELHEWVFGTRTFRKMYGNDGGSDGVDEGYAARAMAGLGAWIMGRNMFGPVRGEWPDHDWKGWWGDTPPYHCPVFVLTHHERPPLEMAGGTVFHFVTDGIESALAQARAAAGERDIRIGGGVETVREYLAARAIDELHIPVAPVLLGKGEALFAGLDLDALGYRVTKQEAGENAVHLTIVRGD
jgi:dihydrofolate reductase